jgi:hypothetical protein
MSHSKNQDNAAASAALGRQQELQHIRDALQGLRFGAVHVIVQDGVVVQIERTEKHRLRRHEAK